jgi:hypothetical protein
MKSTMPEQAASGELVKLVNRLADSRSPYVSQAEPKPCQPYPDFD